MALVRHNLLDERFLGSVPCGPASERAMTCCSGKG
jgi:hypothetical protein